jgi:hypothetical protein
MGELTMNRPFPEHLISSRGFTFAANVHSNPESYVPPPAPKLSSLEQWDAQYKVCIPGVPQSPHVPPQYGEIKTNDGGPYFPVSKETWQMLIGMALDYIRDGGQTGSKVQMVANVRKLACPPSAGLSSRISLTDAKNYVDSVIGYVRELEDDFESISTP